MAVCSYCRSTVVREGDALRRIGQSAELFDDHSPLQLGAAGRYQGLAFTVVGRLQYRYADGTWNEWHVLIDPGGGQGEAAPRSAFLSEDNGQYVLSVEARPQGALPAAETLRAGAPAQVDSQAWSVGSVTTARLVAAEGELPGVPALESAFVVADLRNPQGQVGTLDYADPAAPRWYVGRPVALADLALTGLREASEKTLRGRGVACPSCGTALAPTLATTQSIVCPQCKAVVDVSRGVGADLAWYAQGNAGLSGLQPQLPLGSEGTLDVAGSGAQRWQVVGYVERCELPDDPEDEQVFWREYLLYHRSAGFAFLVDTEDGWSGVRPLAGAPQVLGADRASLDSITYRKLYTYRARVTYVLGEFYWRLERDQATLNTDYQGTGAHARKRLNREETRTGQDGETAHEVVWSGGETIDAAAVARAFGLASPTQAALRRDAQPTSGGGWLAKLFVGMFILAVVFAIARCGSDDCDEVRATFGEASREYQACRSGTGAYARSTGGAWGGFSTGGGHK